MAQKDGGAVQPDRQGLLHRTVPEDRAVPPQVRQEGPGQHKLEVRPVSIPDLGH